jgi:hypothetical protein
MIDRGAHASDSPLPHPPCPCEALSIFRPQQSAAGEQREERVKLCSNAAECCLKLELWREAVQLASDALQDDAAHVKSRLRRAKAALALGQREAASEDLELIVRQGDAAQVKVAAGLLRPIQDEKKSERQAAERAEAARAAAMIRGAGGYGRAEADGAAGSFGGAGGMGGASVRGSGGRGGSAGGLAGGAVAPDAWAHGLGKQARYEWFIDCYRMRLDDDYVLGDGNLHGLYGKSAGLDCSITGDFLGFCKLAVRHGVIPRDGAWRWEEMLQLAGGKDQHGMAPLQCAFEKSDAHKKYGLMGARTLRATAEIVLGCSAQQSWDGNGDEMPAECREILD